MQRKSVNMSAAPAKADEKDAKQNKLKCLVSGATGAIGKEVVQFLLVREEVENVTVLVRKEKSFTAQNKLTEKVVDYQKLDPNDFKGFDVSFCCLGSTIKKAGSQEVFRKLDYELIVVVAKLSKAGGARHFALVSSVGADATSSTFYLRTKGEAEDDVIKEKFELATIYRPSVLDADRPEARCGERMAVCLSKWMCCCCLHCCCAKYEAIHVRTVALAMVRVALNPPKPANGVQIYDGSYAIDVVARGK